MTFRTRILLACLTVAAVPLLILATGARHVVRERLTMQYRQRVAESSALVRRELDRSAAATDARLRALAQRAVDEPDTRAALLDPATRALLLDYAPAALSVAGLDFLLLLDGDGTVLSSGHFRSDYGRTLPALAAHLAAAAGPAVVSAHRPTGAFLVLARARPFDLAGRRFALVGGMEIDSAFAARLTGGSTDLTVTLEQPGAQPIAATEVAVAGHFDIPFIADDGVQAGTARWTIMHSLAPLNATVRLVDRWFVIALGTALLLAFVTARIVAVRVTRPLEELARNASRVELTRYDARLATRRQDEIGSLSRLLDRMVQRLRTAARQLRDAERRATVGDMARQVNHDIRNGLLPIRNVIRHFAEVAREAPAELGAVFNERAGTLQGGIGYLENLATNYARLTPRTERQPCDVNALLHNLVRDAAVPGDDRVKLELSPALPPASADPVALRRALENLAINAVESLADASGRVTLRTRTGGGGDDRRVIIDVVDTGTGIGAAELDRIFDDFYTTKERGTGLGLSIVRRLITDMGGRVNVESEAGRGTTFTIELPADRSGS
jgi:signal transduction histidine kinase